eukprot:9725-Heterococcus_DN1.PRE.7
MCLVKVGIITTLIRRPHRVATGLLLLPFTAHDSILRSAEARASRALFAAEILSSAAIAEYNYCSMLLLLLLPVVIGQTSDIIVANMQKIRYSDVENGSVSCCNTLRDAVMIQTMLHSSLLAAVPQCSALPMMLDATARHSRAIECASYRVIA